ncbi:extracellular solute-binding protein [Laspinema olomoucense]|uniref:Extracellular solute-binding protein n=1 Tax=Laspinema olomoucense D3b TaxID=2953688 RepID=A0ABT2N4A3_9CYAN|nr:MULTISPECIES: extracellular solute-binding protein [unclassified Laspinema]MCT7972364.1 extracellular solute-binding protein [Laspinema sp. D3d]MCT7977487.1 extracellular solute-binding protein [Laspinema sp. D3b]MCT7995321.1 extracellular solute-binding protein [Laspinema sp. D3c]
MNRRSFLVSLSTLAVAQLLSGCGTVDRQTLKIRLLKSSIPAQAMGAFRKQLDKGAVLNFSPAEHLDELFRLLQQWKKPPSNNSDRRWNLPGSNGDAGPSNLADLVTLGNYWLERAIAQKLILPLDPTTLEQWDNLPSQWQTLVRRNAAGKLDPKGQVWGAPYRWGTTVIAYRADKVKNLGWTPQDWSDLWRPELRDRLSLLDSPREVIGLTLKTLGHSYNRDRLADLPELKEKLLALHRQARLYSNDAYLQPLLLGDTWVAVGWSTDILATMQRNPKIRAVVPPSGTALWSELWVRPAGPNPVNTETPPPASSLAKQWINFCWNPEMAVQLSQLGKAVSPMLLNRDREELPPALQTDGILLPTAEAIAKSEFIEPLTPEIAETYQALWREIRLS